MKSRTLIATGGIALLLSAAATVAIAQDRPQHPRGGGGQWAAKADINGDGDVTRQEVMDAKRAEFTRADANGDGTVDINEMATYAEIKKAEREAKRREKRFQRLDADGDGSISVTEFLSRETPRFDRLDRNDDGVLTEDELAKAKKRGERRMKKRRNQENG